MRQPNNKQIDDLIANKKNIYFGDFITRIKNLHISFDEEKIIRAKKLYDELQKYNLQLRSDSILCKKYIQNDGNLTEVIDMMIEMNWFCNNTTYLHNMRYSNYGDIIQRSENTKENIIKHYVLNKHKYIIEPPKTKNIVKFLEKYDNTEKDREKINLWNGDININIYDKIQKTKENENLVNEYLQKYADKYAKDNYKEFLFCNVKKKINENFNNFYPELKKYIENNLYVYFDKYMIEICENTDFKNSLDWYGNYNAYCCNIINDYLYKKIKSKYNYKKILKFLTYDYDFDIWCKHMRGSQKYKTFLCEYIDDYICDYIYDYIYDNNILFIENFDIENIDIAYKIKAQHYICDIFNKNTDYCINKIISQNKDKLKNLSIEDKIKFIIKDKKYNDINKIATNIFLWYLEYDINEIKNPDAYNYLKNTKLYLNPKFKKYTFYLQNLKLNSSAYKIIKCNNMPSPYCPNKCCKNCCPGCNMHNNNIFATK